MSKLTGSIATVTVVPATTTSALLLDTNEFRKAAIIHNNSGQVLHVLFAAAGATTLLHSVTVANQTNYTVPTGYTGPLCGVLAAGTGDVIVTQVE